MNCVKRIWHLLFRPRTVVNAEEVLSAIEARDEAGGDLRRTIDRFVTHNLNTESMEGAMRRLAEQVRK